MGKIKNIYVFTEKIFERLVSLVTSILGNSITFILAFCLVLFWWVNNLFTTRDVHQIVGDIIFGTTFLSLFIIQKSFNRFSGSLHLKVSSHEPAKNSVINSEVKTEREITELSKEYTVLAGQVKELENKIEKDKSTK
jgi:low affinity Fe/Cu permease